MARSTLALLGIGMVLGALLFGPVDTVQGQTDEPQPQQFTLAVRPSPCNVAVQSRIVRAEDGTATARLIAHPPSPCTSVNLGFDTFPPETANCEVVNSEQGAAAIMDCEFTAGHMSTTFFVDANILEQ